MHAPEGLVVLLAFGVTVACISPLPDGAAGVRSALLSLAVPAIVLLRGVSFCPVILLALACAGASLFWSPLPLAGLDLLWHFAVLAGVALIAPSNMRPVYLAIGAGLAVNSAVVVLQIAGLEPISHVEDQPITGLFFHKNHQALFVALALVGLLGHRLWALAAVAALPLIVASSRAALLALAAAGAVAACQRRRWLILPLLVGGVALLLLLLGADGHALANAQRLQTWLDAAAHLTPLGHGLGSFYWRYPEMQHAHSDLLQIAFELGAAGFCVAVAGMCYLLWSGPPVERLILTAFMIEGMVDFPLYQPATGFLAALAAGHLLRVRRDLCCELADGESPDRARPRQSLPV